MPSYNRLTAAKRIELYAMKKADLTQKVRRASRRSSVHDQSGIETQTPVHAGITPSKPIVWPVLARLRFASKRISEARWQGVEERISEDWIPEQISDHLKANGLPSISPQWIYQYICADKSQCGYHQGNETACEQRPHRDL